MKPIIIKVGGSVITYKKSSFPKLNRKNLLTVANQLRSFKKPFILVHGAGSFGHPIVKKTGIDKGIKNKKQLLDFSETQKLQNELNVLVTDVLIKKGIPAFPLQASAMTVMRRGRLIKMDVSAIKGLVKLGLVPVCYGVPAYDEFQGCSILSGDQIVPYLANKFKVEKIISVSDVDGIYTADPKKSKKAIKIPKINRKNYLEVKKFLSGSSATDVTGGMLGKYLEVIDLAKKGVVVQIVHFKNLKKAILNQRVGTIIRL